MKRTKETDNRPSEMAIVCFIAAVLLGLYSLIEKPAHDAYNAHFNPPGRERPTTFYRASVTLETSIDVCTSSCELSTKKDRFGNFYTTRTCYSPTATTGNCYIITEY